MTRSVEVSVTADFCLRSAIRTDVSVTDSSAKTIRNRIIPMDTTKAMKRALLQLRHVILVTVKVANLVKVLF